MFRKNLLKLIDKNFHLIYRSLILCKLSSKGNNLSLIYLGILSFITGISESLPVIIIVPFLTVINNPEKIWEISFFKELSLSLNINSPQDLLIPFLLIFIFVILINAYLKIFSTKYKNNVKAGLGHELTTLAFEKLLYSTYEYQMRIPSSKNINDFNEAIRKCIIYISAFFDIAVASLSIVFIVFSLILVNKFITSILFIFIGISYFLISIFKRKILAKGGRTLLVTRLKQIAIIQESLGSKKDMILDNSHPIIFRKFGRINHRKEYTLSKIDTASSTPKYFVESLFVIILGLLSYLLKYKYSIDPIPTLGAIALGLQKLLPAANSIFVSYTNLKSNYDFTQNILDLIYKTPQDIIVKSNFEEEYFEFNKIELSNITYIYPESKKPIIENLNLTINKGESIGIIGSTGSGKSTFVDIIMCFLKPQKGKILLNGENILDKNNRFHLIKWQRNIAHVPQQIFLKNSTIVENIALGESITEIDFNKVIKSCKIAKIYEFIQSTKYGLYSNVGERGINLSGGQIQRLAIARALYRDVKVIIFDEATSSLDKKTETEVVNSLKSIYKNNLTIISIAHREHTLKGYDRIIKMEKGQIYEEK